MYAIVDIETTGGYADNHRVTEVAIIHHDGLQITHRYQTLINPGRRVPLFITGLTGITNEMVRSAPLFEDVAEDLYEQLKEKVFVAHNAHFDYGFLKKEFEEAGISWTAKKLCTVKLSRKIFPGLDSYSLGRLAESLGITIEDRHRAGGDAEATARIFDLLLKRDDQGVIAKALKRGSGEAILPPNLRKEDVSQLPDKPGVYFFLDARGQVIYVGKAVNLRKRIYGHFTGEASEWNRSNIRNEIHGIRYELTGNELIALILEAQEIRNRWPKYNLAQKVRVEQWGIFDYYDGNGYRRFVVNAVGRQARPLLTFANKSAAWSTLWNKVKEFNLCPKLSGLQTAKGKCFAHQSGSCQGACEGKEDVSAYNARTEAMLSSFESQGATAAILGIGRSPDEQSVILVEQGNYSGFGFVGRGISLEDVTAVRQWIVPGKDNRVAQNLVTSVLQNPEDREILYFD
ncbi:MAG: GIY-YIG nuclease family protein [Cyclobacteriaceae bacterium]|nr:GIY-YIG nuclease family protein [Cyclobacteriaceae bacterium]